MRILCTPFLASLLNAVTEMDNVLMTTLTGNCAPIHLDAHYSVHTESGPPLVCSLVTLSIVGGMTVRSSELTVVLGSMGPDIHAAAS